MVEVCQRKQSLWVWTPRLVRQAGDDLPGSSSLAGGEGEGEGGGAEQSVEGL